MSCLRVLDETVQVPRDCGYFCACTMSTEQRKGDGDSGVRNALIQMRCPTDRSYHHLLQRDRLQNRHFSDVLDNELLTALRISGNFRRGTASCGVLLCEKEAGRTKSIWPTEKRVAIIPGVVRNACGRGIELSWGFQMATGSLIVYAQ